jgi:hypothetical protein
VAWYEYDTKTEAREAYQYRLKVPYRCYRHSRPDEVLRADNPSTDDIERSLAEYGPVCSPMPPLVIEDPGEDMDENVTRLRMKAHYTIPGLDGAWRLMGMSTTGMGANGRCELLMIRTDAAAPVVVSARSLIGADPTTNPQHAAKISERPGYDGGPDGD